MPVNGLTSVKKPSSYLTMTYLWSWRRTVRVMSRVGLFALITSPLARRNPNAIISRAAGPNFGDIFRKWFGHNLLRYVNVNWIDVIMGTKFWQAGFQCSPFGFDYYRSISRFFNVWENSEILDGGFKKKSPRCPISQLQCSQLIIIHILQDSKIRIQKIYDRDTINLILILIISNINCLITNLEATTLKEICRNNIKTQRT